MKVFIGLIEEGVTPLLVSSFVNMKDRKFIYAACLGLLYLSGTVLLVHGKSNFGLPIPRNSFSSWRGDPFHLQHSSSDRSQRTQNDAIIKYEKATDGKDFVTRTSRQQFIRRVYAIFLSQSLATILITGAVISVPALRYFFLVNLGKISALSSIGCLLCALALTLSPTMRFKKPHNFLLLGGYTVFQALTMGALSTLFKPELFLLGSLHTVTALATITLYSFQTNAAYDLTAMGNALLVSLSTLSIGSLLGFLFNVPFIQNVQSILYAVIFALYIAYDTQMIVGGKHRKHKFAENEYIMAALTLYQDIVSLFLQILRILSKAEKRKEE